MLHKLSSWLVSLPWKPVMIGAAGSLVASVIIVLFGLTITNEDIRDIGTVMVGVFTIVGFFLAVVFSPWARGRPERRSFSPAITAVATGETKVHEVVSAYSQAGALRPGAMSGETIDYYPPPARESDWQDIRNFASLRLGEVALIRRLAVAAEERQPARRCVAVLQASGIAHPESSIATLEDLGLLYTDGELVWLTERGRRFIYLSNQAFVHDAPLVSAYRQITPNINRVVRFDGRSLR